MGPNYDHFYPLNFPDDLVWALVFKVKLQGYIHTHIYIHIYIYIYILYIYITFNVKNPLGPCLWFLSCLSSGKLDILHGVPGTDLNGWQHPWRLWLPGERVWEAWLSGCSHRPLGRSPHAQCFIQSQPRSSPLPPWHSMLSRNGRMTPHLNLDSFNQY